MLTPREPDYYSILSVRREASLEEIKQAYHQLVTRFHPDVHPDDTDAEASLRSLNQAYAILRDPRPRASYDRDSAQNFGPHGAGGSWLFGRSQPYSAVSQCGGLPLVHQ